MFMKGYTTCYHMRMHISSLEVLQATQTIRAMQVQQLVSIVRTKYGLFMIDYYSSFQILRYMFFDEFKGFCIKDFACDIF